MLLTSGLDKLKFFSATDYTDFTEKRTKIRVICEIRGYFCQVFLTQNSGFRKTQRE